MVQHEMKEQASARLTAVLWQLNIASSSWYRPPIAAADRKRPGPPPKPIPDEVVHAVVDMATTNPWYGYHRIAVMCRRDGSAVKDRQASLATLTGLSSHFCHSCRGFRSMNSASGTSMNHDYELHKRSM